jgi:eukaryotic-like serine/threonine-protein kinase
MAEVFLARDRILGRDLALKVLREDFAKDADFLSRFQREAVSAASLNHPHVVQVYDQGHAEDGRLYIAMEHVPGGSLKDLTTRRGPLDPAEAARLAAQVAETLGAAHERGIVHRDVKPQNVLIDEAGDAKVADFGIALAASTSTTSGTNRVFGTASYMSPEQAMGERVGPASDLYSLGVVLYEMLTGRVPFEAEGALATAMKHVTDQPVPPRERDPSFPEAMEALVIGLLAKAPEDRCGRARERAGRLFQCRDGPPSRPHLLQGDGGAAEGRGRWWVRALLLVRASLRVGLLLSVRACVAVRVAGPPDVGARRIGAVGTEPAGLGDQGCGTLRLVPRAGRILGRRRPRRGDDEHRGRRVRRPGAIPVG